jgi:hypothetical protein
MACITNNVQNVTAGLRRGKYLAVMGPGLSASAAAVVSVPLESGGAWLRLVLFTLARFTPATNLIPTDKICSGISYPVVYPPAIKQPATQLASLK